MDPLTDGRPALDIATGERDGVATVTVAGELDIATAAALDDAVAGVAQRRPSALLLDLAQLDFVDSDGVRALLRARARARHCGCELRVANVPPKVSRVLDITGVGRMLQAA